MFVASRRLTHCIYSVLPKMHDPMPSTAGRRNAYAMLMKSEVREKKSPCPHPPIYSCRRSMHIPHPQHPPHRTYAEKSARNLSQVPQLVIIETLEVLLLEQDVDALLDVADLGAEAALDLRDALGDQLAVLHLLA